MEWGQIIGAGGGGKGGGSGGGLSEQADTLKSTSYAQVLDLISEGEIGGLVNGMKSIYLDGVPIENADGSANFSGVQYVATNGTQDQPVISGFDQVRNEINVGIECKVVTGPVVRSITNANVTSVIVTVQLPALSHMDDKGNLGGSSVQFAIDVQVGGAGWVEKLNDTISGKSSSAYERQYRIILPAGASRDIRLRRITADSTSTQLNNKTNFKSYTEVIDAKLRYPNSALVGLKVDASQFRAIPTRGYDTRLLLIRVPTNATPRADGSLAYSGTWNGTFKIAWSCCPAWAFYDVITADRYGLGSFLAATPPDKWALYEISRRCNELISNGFGGMEPRFTCNVWINTRQEAHKLLADLTSCFQGMAYSDGSTIIAVQDAPRDPAYLFTNANVTKGDFRYEGTSAKARHTVALVAWNDPADLYRRKVEYVEDTAGIARYGVIETEVLAFACTSRGQAHRVGKWLLLSELMQTETISFSTGAEGALVRPGDLIKIADARRAGVRMGGRVKAAAGAVLTVDLAPSTAPGSQLYVVAPDGAIQQREIVSVIGTQITLTVPFSPMPTAQCGWLISSAAVEAQTARVLTVTEEDGGHSIIALQHEPDKFPAVEQGMVLQPRAISALNPMPGTPTGMALSEQTYLFQSTTRTKLNVRWTAVPHAVRYRVEWRYADGNFQAAETTAPDFDVMDAEPGHYEVRLTAINAAGLPSATSAAASYTVTGYDPLTDPAQQVNITVLGSATIACDYTGAVKPGQVPRVITPTVVKAGVDIRTADFTAYSVSAPGGVDASVNTTAGDTDKGRITIGSGWTSAGVINLTVTVGGVAFGPFPVSVDRSNDPPPNTGGGGGGGGGSGTLYDSTIDAVTSGTFAPVSDVLGNLALASGQKLAVSAPLDYMIYSAMGDVSGQMEIKVQYNSGSGWTDFSAGSVAGSYSSWSSLDYYGEQGFVSLAQEEAGLPAGSYAIRLLARKSAGTPSMATLYPVSGTLTFSIT